MTTILPRGWRPFLIALCFVLVIFGFSIAPPTISAAACTTTLNGGDDIQAAIDAAVAGDVICLSPGTYSSLATIVVDKAITLQGPQFDVDPRPSAGTTRILGGAGEAIIDGMGSLGTIFQITSSNVVLNGFEVKSGSGDLIASPTGGAIEAIHLANLVVYDAGDEGMQVRDCAGCLIEYNYVFDTLGDGINLCCGSVGGMIQYNETNDIDSENAAIYIYDAERSTVFCNFINGTSRNEGIKLGDKDGDDALKEGGAIANNTITNTAQDGIAVYMSATSLVGNDISFSRSENGAIYVTHGVDNIFIYLNTIHDNSFSLLKWQPGGVTVGNSGGQLASGVTILNNNFTGNNPNGVLNLAPDLLTAEYNWWGDASGPGPAGTGSGDGVSANVDFEPWLTEPIEMPPAYCGSPGTITVVKSAAGGGTTEFQFDHNWGDDYTFFLADGESLTSPPLQSGDYTVSERLPLPDGWSLESAVCDNLATEPIESIDPKYYFIVENGDEWVCTFTNVYTAPPSNICPEESASNQWTDIIGKGMGNPKKHNTATKMLIPNYDLVTELYGQMVAKDPGQAKYVRFILPGKNNYVQVDTITSPIDHEYGNFWYGAYVDPAKYVTGRWFLHKSGVKNHIPRALVLYPTYADPENTFVNVWDTFDAAEGEVDWNTAGGWTNYREIKVPIAPPNGPATFNVELALVDNDKDNRPVWVRVTAGGVSQTQMPTGPNAGDQLNLMTFTLADVPAGTDEIVIEVYSPSPALDEVEGDSAMLVGMAANYMCASLP